MSNAPRLLSLIAVGLLVQQGAASPADRPVGQFESHGDIGSPKVAGNAVYNGATQKTR